jgi:hypothetical protein
MKRTAILMALALVAAGCGSKPLSHAAFVRKADAACAARRAQLRALPRPGALIFFARYLDRALPILRKQRHDVGALREPPADKAQVKLLLSRWDAVLADLADMHRASKTGDDAGIAFGLRHAFRDNKAAKEPARKLGLGACSHFSPFTP